MNWYEEYGITKPFYGDDAVCILKGDCREILPSLDKKSCKVCHGEGWYLEPLLGGDYKKELCPHLGIDAVITDPPYELGFMGKDWDKKGISFQPETWRLILDACKPGAHLLCFGGTRTFHRIACAVEDAGWEIRDTLMWVYGQGFPKSHDVSKAIDKSKGCYIKGEILPSSRTTPASETNIATTFREKTATNPQSAEAQQWQGWGTALKPAWEPIILARKPLEGTVAENVLKYGTGVLNIDGCRIPLNGEDTSRKVYQTQSWKNSSKAGVGSVNDNWKQGRFPANLIHDGSDEVLELFPNRDGPWGKDSNLPYKKAGMFGVGYGHVPNERLGKETGSASRFFYCAKASRAERDAGLEGLPDSLGGGMQGTVDKTPLTGSGNIRNNIMKNNHPTVKPLALMRYLIKLITPPNGIVLDPFMGSGSTMVAAGQLGFWAIGIEIDGQYCEIAIKRCGL